jgi:transcriptional regulator with PAS, ATPase and Fis domain
MLTEARRLVTHDDPVLIQGESGTGKELIANLLGSGRKAGRFVAVNVSALPKDLVESILFGYVKGTFTGAQQDREGLVQHAQEGTLFLDEIGDMPLELQCKFLRVMQERKVRRVGATDEEPVKCRFIAATHHDLAESVKLKQFRLDLYARLSTFTLTIPPLRDRPEDVPAICESLSRSFPVAKVDWSKVDLSLNVRSLQQIIRRYTVLGKLPTTKS